MFEQRGFFRSSWLAAGLVVAGLVAVNAAQAIPGPKAAATGPYAKQVEALRATRALLEKADHDYKGHRVKAIEHIHAAIHALHPATGTHPHAAPAKKPAATTGGNEPQKVSDAQLRQAVQHLKKVQDQLSGASGEAAPKAVAAIQNAVKELETALEIR